MSQLIRLSGIPVKNPLAELTIHTTGSELVTAARQLFALLILQYAGYFLLIIPIGWWYRRRGASAYGVTKQVTLGRVPRSLSENGRSS